MDFSFLPQKRFSISLTNEQAVLKETCTSFVFRTCNAKLNVVNQLQVNSVPRGCVASANSEILE
jgi:hypothetical protein